MPPRDLESYGCAVTERKKKNRVPWAKSMGS